MITSLSILLPTYNTPCEDLVRALHKQAIAIANFAFEIIVLDDGSTDSEVIETNKRIDSLSHCRYLIRGYNRGRAATRNELASYARCEWLLFIDSDMVVCNNNYLRQYLSIDKSDVVYGGYEINGDSAKLKNNLRYRYETSYSGNRDASQRNKHPYDDFHTSNFLVRREVMIANLLDERFVRYGYEDVIWGKTLKGKGIAINHIDNPLSFEIFETNTEFIEKTTVGMSTLAEFSNELRGYSRIIATADKLERWHLTKIAKWVFLFAKDKIKQRLTNNKPSIFLFNIYKIGMYLLFSEK